jgi:hypothetical protein
MPRDLRRALAACMLAAVVASAAAHGASTPRVLISVRYEASGIANSCHHTVMVTRARQPVLAARLARLLPRTLPRSRRVPPNPSGAFTSLEIVLSTARRLWFDATPASMLPLVRALEKLSPGCPMPNGG